MVRLRRPPRQRGEAGAAVSGRRMSIRPVSVLGPVMRALSSGRAKRGVSSLVRLCCAMSGEYARHAADAVSASKSKRGRAWCTIRIAGIACAAYPLRVTGSMVVIRPARGAVPASAAALIARFEQPLPASSERHASRLGCTQLCV